MTNNSSALLFRDHDFASNLARIRESMLDQDVLTEFSSDGTILDTIISVLAEVTEKNAITANILHAEGFIGTATLRKNIAQHAAHFGYTPYSKNAAKAIIDVTVTGDLSSNLPSTLTMEKGTVFHSSGNNDTLSFTTTRSYSAQLVGNIYQFDEIEIYQGVYGSTDIFIDYNSRVQVYDIRIADIDTSLLEVYVQSAIDSVDYVELTKASNSITVNSESNVYFLQELEKDNFGLIFGDGILGSKITDKSIVRVIYLKTEAEKANGFKDFIFGYAANQNSLMNTNDVTTTVFTRARASGGFAAENNASVKRNAPRSFVSQNRAVTVQDYENQLKQRFPYINSIAVWAGVNGQGINDQLGRIYVSAVTGQSQYLTEAQKTEIRDEISLKFGVAGILPVIVDADSTYVDIECKVQVTDIVFLRSSEVHKAVVNFADAYILDNLNTFAGRFTHSKFVSGVDNSNPSVDSNLTTISLHKRIIPDLRQNNSFNFTFHNEIIDAFTNSFSFGENYKKAILRSTTSGILNVYELSGINEILIQTNVGTVDFSTGSISISDLPIYLANEITKDLRFFAIPVSNNVVSLQNNVLIGGGISINIQRKA